MQAPARHAMAATTAIVAAIVAIAGAGVVAVTKPTAGTDVTSALALAAVIALWAASGCVLALARPANPVGWIMVAAGAAWGAGEAMFDLARHGIIVAPDSVPGASGLAVAGAALRSAGWLGAAIGLPAVFPDGRPRWLWLRWVLVTTVAASTVGTALAADVEDAGLHAAGWHNPVHLPNFAAGAGDLLATVSLPLMAVSAIGSVAGAVSRWRGGSRLLRRQLIVFSLAAALPILVIPTAFGAGWPSWVFAVCVVPLPVVVAVAVLTGGAFDLATVANRSLVWGALTAAVVGMYALIIAGTGALLGPLHGRWIPWLAAAVVAVSFAPLRQVLQDAVNRVTYGRWREPYHVLADLGSRIEAAPDTDGVLGDVVGELATTLGLAGAALRDTGGEVIAGVPGQDAVVVPLTAYGRPAGQLLYTEPATPLRPGDRRVLDDLAAQLALLMYARSLTADLRSARERLVLAREEERRRLRRDLHDGLGPVLAGLMLRVDSVRAIVTDQPAVAEADLLVLRDDIQAAVVDVRRLVEGLRPPAVDELGLGPALTQAVRRLARPGADFEVVVPEPLPPVPAAVEVAVYRIVAEAVTNTAKHSNAVHCRVELAVRGGAFVADVTDDGQGIDHATGKPGGNGLSTMRERAEELGGTVRIASGASGTTVTATLPLPAQPHGVRN